MSEIIPCVWTGEAFVPESSFMRRLAAKRFGDGEIVALEATGERSIKSHNHQFAEIEEMWRTLPESLAEAPYATSAETLRKHALIVTGFRDCESIVAGSKAAAERISAYVSALARKAHGYAIVDVEGSVVRCYTPHSQSKRAMGPKEFQRSKEAVLGWISGLLESGSAAA